MKTGRAVLLLTCLAALCILGGYGIWQLFSGTEASSLMDGGQLQKGDVTAFGAYEQDADNGNGPEALEWTVLEVQDDRALLLTRDILRPISYHDKYEETVWEDCSLRKWLNGEFLEETFSEEEQERILTVSNENPDNPGMDSHGCGITKDRVFLLRIEEYSAYMRTEEDRFVTGSAEPTAYARTLHLEADDDQGDDPGKACWWLRTSGSDQYSAAFVDRDGSIHAAGAQVSHDTYCGLRPAVWVRI